MHKSALYKKNLLYVDIRRLWHQRFVCTGDCAGFSKAPYCSLDILIYAYYEYVIAIEAESIVKEITSSRVLHECASVRPKWKELIKLGIKKLW